MHGRMDGTVDGWMSGWMTGWAERWMGAVGWIHVSQECRIHFGVLTSTPDEVQSGGRLALAHRHQGSRRRPLGLAELCGSRRRPAPQLAQLRSHPRHLVMEDLLLPLHYLHGPRRARRKLALLTSVFTKKGAGKRMSENTMNLTLDQNNSY